jgi:hypothetical protein
MKKVIIAASLILASTATQAQNKSADSTQFKKIEAQIQSLNKVYADSIAIVSGDIRTKNIELKNNKALTDSSRRVQASSLFTAQREKIVSLRKRQNMAVAALKQKQIESLTPKK